MKKKTRKPTIVEQWVERSKDAHIDPFMGVGDIFGPFSYAKSVMEPFRPTTTIATGTTNESEVKFMTTTRMAKPRTRWKPKYLELQRAHQYDVYIFIGVGLLNALLGAGVAVLLGCGH